MKGLEIRQVTYNGYHLLFALIRTSEIGQHVGGFSRVLGIPDDAMWNATVLNRSTPFKLVLK